MQGNKIKETIETLATLGQIDALVALRDSLRIDYELARDVVGSLINQKPFTSKVESKSTVSGDLSGYNKKWSYPDKFQYVLKRENRFIKFREAAKIIIELEGGGDEDLITKRFTTSTRKLKLDKKIVNVKHGGSLVNTFWGSAKWLDENEKIKPEYMYDIKQVQNYESSRGPGIFDDL